MKVAETQCSEDVRVALDAYIRECVDAGAWPTAEQIMHIVNSSADLSTPMPEPTQMDSVVIFHRLLDRAKDRVLFVSPPYSDRRAESAFLAGYEAALGDIAKGHLDISGTVPA